MGQTLFDRANGWYTISNPDLDDVAEICPTRDIFQARLDTFFREIQVYTQFSEDEAALLVAIVGEIGNNCFDHNLGQWNGVIGCWFSWSFEEGVTVVLSDRGQGILSSLKRVKPDLESETDALKVAFEKRLSGRSPEQRGNGLKFVRSILNHHKNRGLLFFSGSSSIQFGENLEKVSQWGKIDKNKSSGTLAVIFWREE